MKDIETIEDIKLMVNSFYQKVREDELIGPIFNKIIQDNWQEHLEKMYCFWETILLKNHTYFGSPFPPHANMPIDKKHFNRWLEIFKQSMGEHFQGEKADEALWRAKKMAEMFNFKIEYIKESRRN